MKKQQYILVASGLVCLLLIFFFGRTVPHRSTPAPVAQAAGNQPTSIDFAQMLEAARQRLTPSQQVYVKALESSVVRGDVKDQQIKVYRRLAAFWSDSAHLFLPYAYYTGQAAKLENSEKSLTFAAHQFLSELRGVDQPQLKLLMADQAKELFERALELNPNNDSAKIGLGSSYIFGSTSGDASKVMEGVQMIRQVAEKDSTNMYAQLMLGIGGVQSGQLDRAIGRFNTVVKNEPHNLEAIFMLAEAYERKGENANAVRWYTVGKNHMTDSSFAREIEKKIKSLQ